MVPLLKLKEQIFQFVGRFEIYVMAAIRFAIAFAAFTMISRHVGFMEALKDYPIPLILALLSSFLPAGMMIFLGAVLILANFYALSLELCVITALLFLILFCLYLRFSVRQGLYVVLTPLLGTLGVPYVMPGAAGLLGKPYTAVPVVCGTVVYFLLRNVEKNAALFTAGEGINRRNVVTLAVTQIFGDREMYLYLGAFAIATIAVFCVCRLRADRARTIAVVLGAVIQLVIICAGEIYFGNVDAVFGVTVGCVVSAFILLGVDFMSMSLDYSRVEYTQFEDDEYYYYVKAVPKSYVPAADKQVKRINARRIRGRKSTKVKKQQ